MNYKTRDKGNRYVMYKDLRQLFAAGPDEWKKISGEGSRAVSPVFVCVSRCVSISGQNLTNHAKRLTVNITSR